jgi:PilZ domain-containing protein
MLNVRILGMDAGGKPFHLPATTQDISLSGARLTGVTVKLNKGDIVGLQSGGGKSRFKVAWVNGSRDGTYQVGLECMEKGASPWREQMLPQVSAGDRRSEERYHCNGTAALHSAGSATPLWVTVRDVSANGCYVQSVEVVAEGEILSGQFNINGLQLNGVAEVRNSLPTVGMGLLWCDLGFGGQEKLTRILRTLAMNAVDATSGKAIALGHLNRLHQLVANLRERLDRENVQVEAETIGALSEAQEKLAAALKSMQS